MGGHAIEKVGAVSVLAGASLSHGSESPEPLIMSRALSRCALGCHGNWDMPPAENGPSLRGGGSRLRAVATPVPALARGGPPPPRLGAGPLWASISLSKKWDPSLPLAPASSAPPLATGQGRYCLGLSCVVLSLAPFKGCVRNSPSLSGVLTAHLPPSGSAEEAGGDPWGQAPNWGPGQSLLSHGSRGCGEGHVGRRNHTGCTVNSGCSGNGTAGTAGGLGHISPGKLVLSWGISPLGQD